MRPDALAEGRNTTMGEAEAEAEAEAAGFRSLKSPIPYLFGGLALMLALISVALLLLACSYRKYSSSSQEKQSKMVDMDREVNSEPKIVVIMAGDTNPTYLANPIPSSSTTHAEESV